MSCYIYYNILCLFLSYIYFLFFRYMRRTFWHQLRVATLGRKKQKKLQLEANSKNCIIRYVVDRWWEGRRKEREGRREDEKGGMKKKERSRKGTGRKGKGKGRRKEKEQEQGMKKKKIGDWRTGKGRGKEKEQEQGMKKEKIGDWRTDWCVVIYRKVR